MQKILPYTFHITKEEMIDLKEPKTKFCETILKRPIIILLFLTLLMFGILSGLKVMALKGVKMRYIKFIGSKTLSAFETFWLAVLFVLTFFFLYSLVRSIR